ncbi:MAG: N-acetylmuramoyl-L-alanine amidase [Limnochordaceae bacterium]|nr:N-acetylmuramoyl-L-alanine amidase [Limnochordaceae bacterium]
MNNLLAILLALFLMAGVPGGSAPNPSASLPWDGSGSSLTSSEIVNSLPALSELAPRNLRTLSGRTIVVDPGHGGDNPGAHGPHGSREADNNLAIARYLQQDLEQAGARVILTRTGNTTPGFGLVDQLRARVDLANGAGAQVFVSIHNDSNPDLSLSGPTTYYWGSPALARVIQQELVDSLGAVDNGVVRRPLYVLEHTRMPAVLVEAGFITSPADEARLANPTYQRRIALAIARGLARYFGG